MSESGAGIVGRAPPTVDVRLALRWVGLTAAALGIAIVLASTILYARESEFSFLTTYLSDFGASGSWSQVVFNSGMLLVAPLRYLFLILLVIQLVHAGAGRVFGAATLLVGSLVAAGSIGVAAVPFTVSLPLHEASANLYFFGVVILQGMIAVQEWRCRWPTLLPVTSLLVVAVYLVFATLLSLVDRAEGITRSTPVPWEWLAFAALMTWLVAHSLIVPNAPELTRNRSP